MKFCLYLFGFVLALEVVCLSGYAQTPQPSCEGGVGVGSENKARAVLQDACDKINHLYKVEGFPLLVPSVENCTFTFHAASQASPTVGWESFDRTHRPNQGPSAYILADSGRITGFTHMAVQVAMDTTQNTMAQRNPWTQKRSIELATKFAEIFTDKWGIHLSAPNFGGQVVTWSEMSSTGVPFFESGVTVYLSSDYGPYSIGTNLGECPYAERHFKPISRAESIRLGQIEFNRLIVGSFDRRLFRDLKEQKVSLQIVRIDGQGRLAWVAVYCKDKKEIAYSGYHFTIILDAENGKLLRTMNPVVE